MFQRQPFALHRVGQRPSAAWFLSVACLLGLVGAGYYLYSTGWFDLEPMIPESELCSDELAAELLAPFAGTLHRDIAVLSSQLLESQDRVCQISIATQQHVMIVVDILSGPGLRERFREPGQRGVLRSTMAVAPENLTYLKDGIFREIIEGPRFNQDDPAAENDWVILHAAGKAAYIRVAFTRLPWPRTVPNLDRTLNEALNSMKTVRAHVESVRQQQ